MSVIYMQPKHPGRSVMIDRMNAMRAEFEIEAGHRTADARRQYRQEREFGRSPRDARLIVAGLLFCDWRESAARKVRA